MCIRDRPRTGPNAGVPGPAGDASQGPAGAESASSSAGGAAGKACVAEGSRPDCPDGSAAGRAPGDALAVPFAAPSLRGRPAGQPAARS
eukprot:15482765-Alexandrium_andersonii.AAC.1